MNTLDLVNNNQVMLAIINKIAEHNLIIVSADYREVVVKAGCLPVRITWETCACHGGRMWFNQDNTNIHIELSSEEYNEQLGITDPDTELAYYIDNKMIETVRIFEKYVYVVETIGRYKDGKVDTAYFKSVEDASYFVFEESGHDINSEYGEVVHQYPNPDIRMRVTYVSDDGSAIKFKHEKLKNRNGVFEVEREYESKFRVFRKR